MYNTGSETPSSASIYAFFVLSVYNVDRRPARRRILLAWDRELASQRVLSSTADMALSTSSSCWAIIALGLLPILSQKTLTPFPAHFSSLWLSL